MRRFVAIILLSAFLLQTTGSASAASTGRTRLPAIEATFLASIVSIKNTLAGTMLGALATGQMSQYQAMHDTPPDFTVLKFHRQADLSPVRINSAATARPSFGSRVEAPNGMALMRPPAPSRAQAAQPAGSSAAISMRSFRAVTATLAQGAVAPSSAARSQGARAMLVDTSVPSAAGINAFWEYEEGGIPGSGKYMVNVANGNLVVQGDDVDIPERGIDLTFRRTYNSASLHDWHAGDGSTVGNYGGGWTNNLDSHLGYDQARSVISWYDIDGTRYDYQCAGTVCTAPAGQYATMTYDSGCGYWLQKKSGTAYHYWAPTFNSTITPNCFTSNPAPFGGVLGRVVTIWARNEANSLQFTYSWDGGDSSSASHLAQILVQHSDGQSLTLTFGDVNAQRVLLSILLPDGDSVRYGYDSAIELSDVCTPGNGNTDSSPGASTICGDTTHIHHRYGYAGGPNVHQLTWADSPNWTMSWGTSASNGWVNFGYDSSNRVSTVDLSGIFNFAPSDGTGTYLVPTAPVGAQILTETNYTYSAGLTQVTDTDGHATKYTYDNLGRITERQAWQGAVYLPSYSTWDTHDNLIASTDARGNTTDYAYDGNGNTIAVAVPSVTTNVGTFQPTTLLSYDGFNNVTASCDPVSVGAAGYDWVNRPTDSHCATHAGRTTYVWSYGDGFEPFGLLTDTYTPLGYHHQYLYNPSAQGGDFGLPSDVIGDPITGQQNGVSRQPHQSFTYDSYGDLKTYTAGAGTTTLSYDTSNRPTSITDADGIVDRTCYLSNGQIRATQTAAQYAADSGLQCGSNSASYTYDADGNNLTKVRHFGNVAGTTQNWYDGADRLVEVGLPHDPTDVYSSHWLTRDIYDLSEGQLQTAGNGASFYAHGNLFKTQEYLGGWGDLKADAFDVLDRGTAHYQYQPGTNNFTHSTLQYDLTTATYGLLSQKTDALDETATYSYDADSKLTDISYTGDGGVTPSETMISDPDGRVISTTSSSMGTLTSQYDADGRTTQVQEAAGGGITSPATYTYAYFNDGMKKSLSVVSSALTQQNMLQYSYQNDGKRTALAFTDGSATAAMTWTYSPAGRVQALADSSGQPTRLITYDAYGEVQKDQMASGTTSSITHDDEGEVTGFSDPNGYNAVINYTNRGELEYEHAAGGCSLGPTDDSEYSPIRQDSANGYMVAKTQQTCSLWIPSGATWDTRTGAGLGSDGTDSLGDGTAVSYYFDAAGRQLGGSQTWQWSHPCGQDSCQVNGTGTRTKSYDAENHLISDNVTTWDVGAGALSGCLQSANHAGIVPNMAGGIWTYAWGPNAHPDVWSYSNFVSPINYGVHWDGDTPLFVTSSSTAVSEVKVEGLGYYVAGSPFKFLDRNQSGFVVASHWSGGKTAYTPADAQHQTCDGSDISGMVLFEPGSDGVSDGANVIQGVRSYDPGTGQWSAPDAYSGDVRDPMSQKSFMWNNNNAFVFTDPSGFAPVPNQAIEQYQPPPQPLPTPAGCQFEPLCGDAQNGHYHGMDQAATAGREHWQAEINLIGLGGSDEAGTRLYCNGPDSCGYGTELSVSRGTKTDDIDTLSTDQGILHWHPPGTGEEDLNGHSDNANEILRHNPAPFSIYTVYNNILVKQVFNGSVNPSDTQPWTEVH